MDALISELQRQYHCTLEMYQSVLEACTDEIWNKAFHGEAHLTFWREAYHAIFWVHNFLGAGDKIFEMQPFGRDIDPRLSAPPNNTCDRSEVLGYAAQTRSYADTVFALLTLDDLRAADAYGESEFDSVCHRLLYGLRHGQHHIGRLAAYLDQEGIQVDSWRG